MSVVKLVHFRIHTRVQRSRTSKRGFRPTDAIYQPKEALKPYFGAHGEEEIPVPIPNTEVKLVSGDYTATSGKLARCRIIKNLR